MVSFPKHLAHNAGRALESLTPIGYRIERTGRTWFRRLLRKPRTVSEGPNLLPVLIQVLACFSKVDGELLEEEIDSSLGFLRYDYPEAVYSELRKLFRQALHEQQDLEAMAQKLAGQLSEERKVMLGVQLYDLIARAGLPQESVINFYSFMTQLGMAAQAIDIVYQLNATESADSNVFQKGSSPLESLTFGSDSSSDVVQSGLGPGDRLIAFRYRDLILLKNLSAAPITVRGRPLRRNTFCRAYPGQRIIVGEHVLTHQDLLNYFNAKKNLSQTSVFISINDDNVVQLERTRTRDSCLEIAFGLRVTVRALRNVPAVLNKVQLKAGTIVEATLDETIEFHNNTELHLSELRRRARAMGARFQLKASKREYLVSNNPTLLDEDDILLSPGTSGDVLLKISCDYEARVGRVEVQQADRPIMIDDTPVRNWAELRDGDRIRIDPGQVLVCDFTERVIEEERNIISQLEIRDVSHKFRGGTVALDGISASIARGEMVCVMGSSGCGKSTMMKTIAGQLEPSHGRILLNGLSLYDNLEQLKKYVAYIPQDDAFDEHLTIGENLELAAALRSPHLSTRDRSRRIDGKLIELGLSERRDSVVGSPTRKILSGGERKRLNIGLDMIGSADVYLFDEPTSGLSSKDSEHVIEIIRSMSHNKIVLVTIHQPSSKLFRMFNKALLLDKGGRLVFFGTPMEMLNYFAEAEHQQHFGTNMGACPSCGSTRPDFIFDVLETPLRDLSGDIIYEENHRGQLIPARRYSPEYWRDKYESHRLLQDVKQVSVSRETPATPPPPSGNALKRVTIRWRDEWVQFRALFKRAFISKLRNRANLLTSIVEAPMLAALIGLVLRYSEAETYDFASAFHIPTYLFLSLVVAMFLGLTNSADDIIRDRSILQRERNLDIRLPYYITAKALTLGLFALIQCVLFVLIGNTILEIRGMFWTYLGFTFITAFSGVAIGLLISSLVNDGKTASNIVPLVLIPQIIMGGALIEYEQMNRDLDFVYALTRRFQEPEQIAKEQSDLQVPLICEFMPMRWSYEALVVAQAKLNPLTIRQTAVNEAIQKLVAKPNLSDAELDRLSTLKNALAFVSGAEGADKSEVMDELQEIDRILAGAELDYDDFAMSEAPDPVTAEQLFVNQKVTDLVSKSEMEENDYRNGGSSNVFFGLEKRYFGIKAGVFVMNSMVLILFTLVSFVLLYISLKRQLRLQRTRN